MVPPEEDDISIEDQAKSLQQLSLHLKDTELFSKVRLVNKKHFPVSEICPWGNRFQTLQYF